MARICFEKSKTPCLFCFFFFKFYFKAPCSFVHIQTWCFVFVLRSQSSALINASFPNLLNPPRSLITLSPFATPLLSLFFPPSQEPAAVNPLPLSVLASRLSLSPRNRSVNPPRSRPLTARREPGFREV